MMNMSHVAVRIVVAFTTGICLLDITGQSFAAEVQDAIRKFDPRTREFVPVGPENVVAGKIYNYYSRRRQGYVWAYALKDGNFSYALGPGTTEVPENFALTTSTQETERLYEQRTYGGDRSAWEDGGYKVRLGEDDQWSVLESATAVCRSHYDLDSRRRWEWHGNRRVAVGFLHGYTWRYEDGRYLQDHSLRMSAFRVDGCYTRMP
jgi:hypothetical protein